MGRRLLAVCVCLILLPLIFGAGAERAGEPYLISRAMYEGMKNAEAVYWSGGITVLLQNGDQGELVNMVTGESVLSNVCQFVKAGSKMFAVTNNREYYLLDGEGYPVRKFPGTTSEFGIEIWQDPESGEAYMLFYREGLCFVCGENGERIWEGDYSLVYNGHLRYFTNGRLTGYRESDGRAVVLDAGSGKEIHAFAPSCFWRPYDGQCQIYNDNTAIMDIADEKGETIGSMVVDLDGRILIRTSAYIHDRMASDFYKWDTGSGFSGEEKYYWDQNECRIWHETKTEDSEGTLISDVMEPVRPGQVIPETVYEEAIADGSAKGKYLMPQPEIRFEWLDRGVRITAQDGEVLGGQTWEDIWIADGGDGVDYSLEQFFQIMGFLPVEAADHCWGVLAPDGSMILPAEYDRITGAETGYDYTECGFLTWKDGEMRIFDLQGRPVFDVATE